MAEDIATKKSVALKGHKYVIDTNGVTKSYTLVTVGYTPTHARTRSVNVNVICQCSNLDFLYSKV